MPLVGDTVRLKVTFQDYDGVLIDPTDIKLTIYDQSTKKIIAGPFDITDDNRSGSGTYFYDYTLPIGLTALVYEYIGNYNGKPIVGRSTLTREWTR